MGGRWEEELCLFPGGCSQKISELRWEERRSKGLRWEEKEGVGRESRERRGEDTEGGGMGEGER